MSNFLSGMAGGATVAIVIKAYDEYSKELKNAQEAIDGAGKANTLMSKAMTAATVTGAIAVTKAIYDLGSAAARAENIGNAFTNMYGTRAPMALEELKKATKGAVSDMELMRAANQAMLLGIDENALPKMFKGAFAVSQATGRPVAQAIEDISLGIARQSKPILDNLGIMIDVEKVQREYAASIGKTTLQLTENEKAIAFTNAALEGLEKNQRRVGETADNAAISSQQLAAKFDNLKVSAGEFFGPGLNLALQGGTSALNGFMDAMKLTRENMQKEREEMMRTLDPVGYASQIEGKKSLQRMRDAEKFVGLTKEYQELVKAGVMTMDEAIASSTVQNVNLEVQNDTVSLINQKISEGNQKLKEKNDELFIGWLVEQGITVESEKQLAMYRAQFDSIQKIGDEAERIYNFTKKTVDYGGYGNYAKTGFGEFSSRSNASLLSSNAGGGYSVRGASNIKLNDGIISPKGDVITTHPDDYIIATKKPGELGGGGGVTVYIDTVQGLDADAVAEALMDKLSKSIMI